MMNNSILIDYTESPFTKSSVTKSIGYKEHISLHQKLLTDMSKTLAAITKYKIKLRLGNWRMSFAVP